jgi:hypothetical protein
MIAGPEKVNAVVPDEIIQFLSHGCFSDRGINRNAPCIEHAKLFILQTRPEKFHV